MNWVLDAAAVVWRSFIDVVSYPIDPSERVYVLYLLTSLLCATCVFVVTRKPDHVDPHAPGALVRFARFVFPREVWTHRSSWVDIRYFIPHQMVRLWIYTGFATLVATAVARWTHLGLTELRTAPGPIFEVESGWGLSAFYTLVSIVVIDFLSYVTHYGQHRIPILWQFHKVHHSAEVLNPLTNYREHPVDNVAYAAVLSMGTGAIAGVFLSVFGAAPSFVTIVGVNAGVFVFNVSGYHLRHSHIWLRWPGRLAYVFGCPAHHQIHHSCRPEHINKNMAFLFPIWDVLFGTFYLPERQEDVVFGIGDGTEAEYKSFLTLYFRPFIELLRPRRQPHR